MQRAVRRVLSAQFEALKQALADHPTIEFVAPRQMRGVIQRETPTDIVNALMDPATWERVFVTDVADALGTAYVDTARQGYEDVEAFYAANGAQAAFPTIPARPLPELAGDAVRGQTVRLAGQVNQSTLKMVSDQLERSLRDGDTIDDFTKKLAPTFGQKRAKRISRTEILAATEQGQLEGWKSTGVVVRKEWITSRDADVRDTHQLNAHGEPMDGYTVGIDDPYVLSGEFGMEYANAPRANTLSAGNRVNCRCQSVAVSDLFEGIELGEF